MLSHYSSHSWKEAVAKRWKTTCCLTNYREDVAILIIKAGIWQSWISCDCLNCRFLRRNMTTVTSILNTRSSTSCAAGIRDKSDGLPFFSNHSNPFRTYQNTRLDTRTTSSVSRCWHEIAPFEFHVLRFLFTGAEKHLEFSDQMERILLCIEKTDHL